MKRFKAIKHILFCGLLSISPSIILAQSGDSAMGLDSTQTENELIKQLTSDEISLGNNMVLTHKELSSAISYTTGEQIEKMNTINPANSLYGLIPGLTVLQNSGSASWRDPNLFIRGLNTTGNRNILVLIDGIEGDIARLSSLSIEKVEILKDAAALAIYGQQGANGVLLVTTKRGVKGKMAIDVQLESGLHHATQLPQMLDAANYAERVNEAMKYDGLAPKYSDDAIAKYRSGESPSLYPNVNWLDEAYKDWGNQTNLNINFRGGDKKVMYFAEIDYRNENGLYSQEYNTADFSTQLSYDRIAFRNNLDIEVTPTTDFKVWVAGSIDETNQPGANTSTTNTSVFTTPANAFPIKNYNDNWGGSNIYPNNPLAMMSSTGYNRFQGFDILLKGSITQELSVLAEGLSAEFTGGLNTSSSSQDWKTQDYMYENLYYKEASATSAADTISTIYDENTPLNASSSLGRVYRNANVSTKVRYDKEWDDHSLSSFLMYSQNKYVGKGQYTTYLRQSMSTYLHYGYKGKYFGDLTLSYGGTSQLPVGDQFNLYPAISGAWVISEEEFIDTKGAIKYLKLRSSFGYAGSDRIVQNTEDTQYNNVGGYNFGESNSNFWAAGILRMAGQPKTERAMMTNFGVDANLFGKLNIMFDAFYHKRTNILVNPAGVSSSIVGVSPPYKSIGESINRGLEMSMTWQDQIGDFSYSATGQFSFSRSKINEMGELPMPYDYLKRTGRPIGQSYGLESNGFFANAAEIANSPTQMFSSVSPGDVKYVDQNGDGLIDELDIVPMGHNYITPEIYYSLNLNAEYKGFGVSALLQGAANYTANLNTPSIYKPLINNQNISEFSNDRWTEATAATATLPRLTTLDNDNNYRANDIWLVSRSFLKVRNVQLYYNWQPKSLLKIKNVKFYVSGSNLFSMDNIDQMDPEMITINYPATTTYNAGLKLNF